MSLDPVLLKSAVCAIAPSSVKKKRLPCVSNTQGNISLFSIFRPTPPVIKTIRDFEQSEATFEVFGKMIFA